MKIVYRTVKNIFLQGCTNEIKKTIWASLIKSSCCSLIHLVCRRSRWYKTFSFLLFNLKQPFIFSFHTLLSTYLFVQTDWNHLHSRHPSLHLSLSFPCSLTHFKVSHCVIFLRKAAAVDESDTAAELLIHLLHQMHSTTSKDTQPHTSGQTEACQELSVTPLHCTDKS